MIRNLKALGLALCTAFAFSAVATSAASAQDKITTPGATFLTGIQTGTPSENVFGAKSSAVSVTCTGVTYTGSTVAVAESVEVTPAYTGCTAFGAAAAVDVNGCKWVFTGTTHETKDTNGVANGKEATVHLNCGHTGSIKVTGLGGCTLTFEDTHTVGQPTVNQNLLGVRYTNGQNVGTWDFEVDATVDNITYTSTSQCTPFGFQHPTGTNWFWTQKITFKGYSDAAHTKQVSVTVT